MISLSSPLQQVVNDLTRGIQFGRLRLWNIISETVYECDRNRIVLSLEQLQDQ